MRKILTLFIVAITFSSYAREVIRDDWAYYKKEEIELYQQQSELSKRAGHLVALKLAKKSIIEGRLEAAKFFLDRLPESGDSLVLIKKRYLSLIAFIEGKYEDSLELTSNAQFNDAKYYQEICMVRLLSSFGLNNTQKFNDEFRNCLGTTFIYSDTDHYWTRTMADVKNRDEILLRGQGFESIRVILGNLDLTKIWLKLALYLNRENIAYKYLDSLTEETYRSKSARELIGFIYYRMGDKKKAFEFIEDIDSANAENIKGNLRLDSGEYELAYGHFKLALKAKSNSLNAMERILPLIWLLEQWEEGEDILSRVQTEYFDEKGKVALDTAIKIRKEQFDIADKNLNRLDQMFKGKVPLEIEQMAMVNAMRRTKTNEAEDFASRACRRLDGLACWILLSNITWENLGKTAMRNEPVVTKNFNPDEYKLNIETTPLTEKIFIDQKDIEELDSISVMKFLENP